MPLLLLLLLHRETISKSTGELNVRVRMKITIVIIVHLKPPAALFADPMTGNIYISQHEGHTVSIFNPLLKTFKDFPSLDPNGLPFGMAMDSSYRNLWVAEHTINKIAVIDPRTGTSKEVTIPHPAPIVQWITADLKGNIWLAEQRGNALAVITSSPKLGQPSTSPVNPATPEVSQ